MSFAKPVRDLSKLPEPQTFYRLPPAQRIMPPDPEPRIHFKNGCLTLAAYESPTWRGSPYFYRTKEWLTEKDIVIAAAHYTEKIWAIGSYNRIHQLMLQLVKAEFGEEAAEACERAMCRYNAQATYYHDEDIEPLITLSQRCKKPASKQ